MKGWKGLTRRAPHKQRETTVKGSGVQRSGNEELLKRVHQSVFSVSVPLEAMPLVEKMLADVCAKNWEKPEKFFFLTVYKKLCVVSVKANAPTDLVAWFVRLQEKKLEGGTWDFRAFRRLRDRRWDLALCGVTCSAVTRDALIEILAERLLGFMPIDSVSLRLESSRRDGPKGGMYFFNCDSVAQQLEVQRRLQGLQVGLFNVVAVARDVSQSAARSGTTEHNAVGGGSGQGPTEKKKNDENEGGPRGSNGGELKAALFKLSEEVAGLRLEVRTLRVQTAETEVVETVPLHCGNQDSGTTPISTADVPKGGETRPRKSEETSSDSFDSEKAVETLLKYRKIAGDGRDDSTGEDGVFLESGESEEGQRLPSCVDLSAQEW